MSAIRVIAAIIGVIRNCRETRNFATGKKNNKQMRKIITALALLMNVIAAGAQNTKEMTQLKMTQEWDKVFPKSEKVNHEKISFHNHFGFELAADVYKPKNAQGRLAAIAVCGPFGAVKEQSSGLYAQTLAERGFLAIAFDPSFTGESSGQPRDVFSLDINTEDFQAAADYLSNRPDVDAGRGWYQEWGKPARQLLPGDVVNIPANVKHWHGAARDSWFAHLAMPVPGEDVSNEWLEPVNDEEYNKLK